MVPDSKTTRLLRSSHHTAIKDRISKRFSQMDIFSWTKNCQAPVHQVPMKGHFKSDAWWMETPQDYWLSDKQRIKISIPHPCLITWSISTWELTTLPCFQQSRYSSYPLFSPELTVSKNWSRSQVTRIFCFKELLTPKVKHHWPWYDRSVSKNCLREEGFQVSAQHPVLQQELTPSFTLITTHSIPTLG